MKHPILLTLACAASLGACGDDGPNKPSSTSSSGGDSGGSGSWAVGERGAMVRLTPEGEVSHYPLELGEDLRAIACKGKEQAVVAGAAGVLLRTFDGGASWDQLDLGGAVELRAVALSAGPTGYVVGDGVVFRSLDDSRTWDAVPSEAHDWTGVTTTAAGTTALLTSAAGEIWRLRDVTLERVYAGDGAVLGGVAVTPDGQQAVAVGQAGLLLRSADAGDHWRAEPLATTRDLHAVRIAGDASLVLAVGEAGVVVRLGADDTSIAETLDPALALRGLHLSVSHGHAVGDDGVMLGTHDGGRTWEPVDLGLDVDLYGLDDLHGEPHL